MLGFGVAPGAVEPLEGRQAVAAGGLGFVPVAPDRLQAGAHQVVPGHQAGMLPDSCQLAMAQDLDDADVLLPVVGHQGH